MKYPTSAEAEAMADLLMRQSAKATTPDAEKTMAEAARVLSGLIEAHHAVINSAKAAAEGIQRAIVEDGDEVGAAALAGVLLQRLAEFG